MKNYSIVFCIFLTLVSCTKKTEEHQHQAAKTEHTEVATAVEYTCPMHPQVIDTKAGICPICKMDLVKKTAGKSGALTDSVALTERDKVSANVATLAVQNSRLQREFTAYGALDFAEQTRRVIAARWNGRIEKLLANQTGTEIAKGQALFEIYSADVLQAQNELLLALRQDSESLSLLVVSARKKLELFGWTEKQIQDLERSKQAKYTWTYYAPFGGTVLEKKAVEGMYVSEGTTLFELGDLSLLWNIAEVSEHDVSAIRQGQAVEMRVQAFPNETFRGKITLIYPTVNAETRTVKIRTELTNSGKKLRPKMFTETVFRQDFGVGIAVPETAVLLTGTRNVVWIKDQSGAFIAREVRLGAKIGGKYHVLSGLHEGDEIAVSGGYLIDSESRLRSGK